MMKRISCLCLLLVLTVAVPAYSEAKSGMIKKLVDADTYEIAIDGKDVRIQLMGVKTQEAADEDASKNTEFGKATLKHIQKILKKGTAVQVEFEGQKTAGEKGDRLAYVRMAAPPKAGKEAKEKPDIVHVNIELVKWGWSPYCTEYGRSGKYDIEFRRAEMHGRTKKLGIWASEDQAEEYKKKRIEWDAKAVEIHDPAGNVGNVNEDGIEHGVRRDLGDDKVPMASGRLMMMRKKPIEYPYVSSEKMKVFHTRDCKEALMIPNAEVIKYVTRQRALIDNKTPCPLCNP